MELRGTGIWSTALATADDTEVAGVAAELEDLGYGSLWMPTFGPGAFERVELLLRETRDIVVATGILSIWLYPARETAGAHARIVEAHGERFLVGLGVSHAPVVDMFVPGTTYEKPLQKMVTYLDELDVAPDPLPVSQRVLAALGPKMLDLAGARTAGAHPYNVTPEHTARARAALGSGGLLVPEQAVALTSDPDAARQWGRAFLENYLGLPNYVGNLLRLGFTADDVAGGGSDRLVDALVAWGDVDVIATRVGEHRDAGADSVCIQVLQDGPMGGIMGFRLDVYRELAPALCT